MIFAQTSNLFLLLSKKEPYGKKSSFKYFINDNYNIRPLCVKPPRMIGYAKYFESNITMSFKLIDKKLIKKDIEIWKKEPV